MSAAVLGPSLVERIAVCKIVFVTVAIDFVLELKAKVGSYSLLRSSPFGTRTDLLYVFQFAEGDAGILKQKIARDLLTKAAASPTKLAQLVSASPHERRPSPVPDRRGDPSSPPHAPALERHRARRGVRRKRRPVSRADQSTRSATG